MMVTFFSRVTTVLLIMTIVMVRALVIRMVRLLAKMITSST